jgi:hypothetical protein
VKFSIGRLWAAFTSPNDRLLYDEKQEENKWRPWTSDIGAALLIAKITKKEKV